MAFTSIWTDETLAKAKQLRADGMPYRKIAAALKVSHGSVRYQLNPHHRDLCLASAKRQREKRV